MGLFKSIFKKKTQLTPTKKVKGIMQRFALVSFVGIDPSKMKNEEAGQLCLIYMFGAVDMLCQSHQLGPESTIDLFQSMLQEELGDYSPEEAKKVAQVTIRASAEPSGKDIMREGGEALRMWIAGVALAPHRLQELLAAIG